MSLGCEIALETPENVFLVRGAMKIHPVPKMHMVPVTVQESALATFGLDKAAFLERVSPN